MMKILYVITARGGSKGVPHKNIIDLGGMPLIAYKINAVKKSSYDYRLIVSTDDPEIARVGIEYGAEVPFFRPKELASDTANSMDVVAHALEWIENNDNSKYDYICMLEPSSPFLTGDDIDKAFGEMERTGADTLLGMREVEVVRAFIDVLDEEGKLSHFYNRIKQMKSVRRQDQNKEYTMNGCIYAAKYDYFKKNKLFHSINSIPYIMPINRSIEIDTMEDYFYAEYMIEKGIIHVDEWK